MFKKNTNYITSVAYFFITIVFFSCKKEPPIPSDNLPLPLNIENPNPSKLALNVLLMDSVQYLGDTSSYLFTHYFNSKFIAYSSKFKINNLTLTCLFSFKNYLTNTGIYTCVKEFSESNSDNEVIIEFKGFNNSDFNSVTPKEGCKIYISKSNNIFNIDAKDLVLFHNYNTSLNDNNYYEHKLSLNFSKKIPVIPTENFIYTVPINRENNYLSVNSTFLGVFVKSIDFFYNRTRVANVQSTMNHSSFYFSDNLPPTGTYITTSSIDSLKSGKVFIETITPNNSYWSSNSGKITVVTNNKTISIYPLITVLEQHNGKDAPTITLSGGMNIHFNSIYLY